jgi:hypothetical protein
VILEFWDARVGTELGSEIMIKCQIPRKVVLITSDMLFKVECHRRFTALIMPSSEVCNIKIEYLFQSL